MKSDTEFERRMQDLRSRAEARLAESTLQRAPYADEYARLLHDLHVHQIELELQNEELRSAQQELERSRDRYLELYHHAPVGYVVTDSAGMILQANQTFSQMLNQDLSFVLHKPLSRMIHAQDQDIFLSRFRAFCNNPKDKRLEMRMLKQDGAIIHTALEGRRIDLSVASDPTDRSSARLLITINDITSTKMTEQAIIRAKQQWEQTFDAVPDLMAIINNKSEIVRVNKALAMRLGVAPQDCVGRKCYQVLHENRMRPSDCPHQQFLISGRLSETEAYNPVLKGHFITTVSPFKVDDRQATWCIHIARDVTDRKKAEKELLKLRNLESLGTLAGGIAHDFNNILAAQVGNIELAKIQYHNRTKAQACLDNALEASFRAKDLANWLLTFAQGGDPMSQPVILDRLIEEAAREGLKDSDVTYDLQLAEPLEPVAMDAVQVKAALRSIIDNAREAMPRGGGLVIKTSMVTFSDEKDQVLSPGRYVKIEFQDQGVGIASTNVDKIFDPYFTTKPMGARKGTGLGLALCHSIIKKHSGHIEVQSVEGRGTNIGVYLPLRPRPVEAAKPAPTAAAVDAGHRPRLLIMDDEEIVWDVIRSMLQGIDCEAEFVSNGHDAVALYKQSLKKGDPYAALILDLTIRGGMGAKEVIQNILDVDRDAKAAVISGYSTDPVFIDYRRFGFAGALQKPFQVEEFQALVLQMLAESRQPRDIES